MRNRESGGRRRGSAILESAFVFLPFFAIVFAIIDYSVVIFIQSTFKHAAREGTRFGITNRTLGGACHRDSIKSVVQQNSMGFLQTADLNKIVVTYINPATQQIIAGAGGNNGGNIVQVEISPCLQQDGIDCFNWTFMAPIWRTKSPINVTAASAAMMEAPPFGVLPCL